MNVILLDRVSSHKPGEKIKVKPGHARNYLIPQGKALPATPANIERFESQRAEFERAAQDRFNDAENRAKALEGVQVTIEAQAGEEGRLFGSVTAHEIVRALADAGHTVAKSEVKMPEGPIRQIGEYELECHLYGHEVIARIKVLVQPA